MRIPPLYPSRIFTRKPGHKSQGYLTSLYRANVKTHQPNVFNKITKFFKSIYYANK